MEVTSQVFEDMQEQNCYLSQQLHAKDNVNLKLPIRINFIQLQKLVEAETDGYKQWVCLNLIFITLRIIIFISFVVLDFFSNIFLDRCFK